jgi:hypothetical protein
MDYRKDITKTENITKDCRRHEGNQSTSMTLHHHLLYIKGEVE